MESDGSCHMTQIDETVSTYLIACAVEANSVDTVWSYRTSLADFRRVGARLAGLTRGLHRVAPVLLPQRPPSTRSQSRLPASPSPRGEGLLLLVQGALSFAAENVFARVPLVKLEQQIVQPPLPAKIHALLSDQDRTVHHDCRNYAPMLFLLDTDGRAPECVSVRRYSSSYRSKQAALRHDRFSPCDQMLAGMDAAVCPGSRQRFDGRPAR